MTVHPAPPLIERRTYNLWPETGRLLGIGRSATYLAARRGDIPVIAVGGRRLVPREALERLLAGPAASVLANADDSNT